MSGNLYFIGPIGSSGGGGGGGAASAGSPGEEVTATQAANTVTGVAATGNWGSVTSVALNAGDWIVYGTAGFNENGAVITDYISCGISQSATGVGIGEFDTTRLAFIGAGGDIVSPTPIYRVNSSSSVTVHLNTKFNYSSGTPRHRGKITAYRLR